MFKFNTLDEAKIYWIDSSCSFNKIISSVPNVYVYFLYLPSFAAIVKFCSLIF